MPSLPVLRNKCLERLLRSTLGRLVNGSVNVLLDAALDRASTETKRMEMIAEIIAVSGIPEDVMAKPALKPRHKASVEAIRSSFRADVAWN